MTIVNDVVSDNWAGVYRPGDEYEGWDVYEPMSSDHAPLEIQADGDFPDVFHEDADAWRHVVNRAAHGSALHLRALALLALASPEELFGIAQFLFFGEYRISIERSPEP